MREMIGLLLAVVLGAACRYFQVPVPAPPKLFGALLVVGISAGYVGVDHLLSH